jgi:hypothetical protein
MLLIATINAFTIDGNPAAVGSPLPIDPEDLQDAANMARDYVASLPPAQFPNMIAVADELALSDPDERFELLIDGLSRWAAAG